MPRQGHMLTLLARLQRVRHCIVVPTVLWTSHVVSALLAGWTAARAPPVLCAIATLLVQESAACVPLLCALLTLCHLPTRGSSLGTPTASKPVVEGSAGHGRAREPHATSTAQHTAAASRMCRVQCSHPWGHIHTHTSSIILQRCPWLCMHIPYRYTFMDPCPHTVVGAGPAARDCTACARR